MSRPVTEDDLQAYVDDALDPARREDVARYLAGHAEVAARMRDYAAQRQALRTAFAPGGTAPLPPRLNLLRLLEARMTRRRTLWRTAAAILLSLGVGGAAGWLARGGPPVSRTDRAMILLTEQALASHAVYAVDPRRPVELDADARDDLAQWLSNRLKRPLAVPDLMAAGYALLGGRLLATERGGAAALFVYADRQGQRASVLLRPMAPELRAPPREDRSGRVSVCAWIESGLGYAVAGALPDETLDELADRVRASLRAPD
ncbi:Anti-sigma factor [Rhodovastum atsumiense]|uniref:Anti-sigma factor n=1 Tax=Rhodovastum atsumiense TaxID=504468 RepID=A0A5M6IN96_9PROT|nr:anti-sigma factor [Rhodovastum atsumiense]KAA5609467.1 anti-sigma factor [Rhodovastum atsumiense]CAH2603553.1 Anti-sigma factor [Rhodovastum atsumiense]